MVIGHNALLWHEAVLCKTLALLADHTVLFKMPQLVGAAKSAGDLAMACPAQGSRVFAQQGESPAETSSMSGVDE